MSAEREKALAAKGRHIALVIAATMLGWLAVTLFIGPALGLAGRYALLFDFAALAGFIYAGVNIFQLWRMRQDSQR
ncbi:DUF5337 domain-containing protein [Phaeobacter italicus]|jgi:hypothetical protein|uniref:Uncharacterized protein n=1 Tax=Phaeobacter italicus TaxID=481446 RepID=A0A0H5D9F4_9RHOB|nr:DUF5337 domain-containing protein [Phaeobacter italicus]EEB70655.1 conserved hypothetical protein [Ruegeria sp. R11]MEE2817339.1 DUF5337 domain-containing protein [Pseudomonadota bacterium]NKX71241.1 DUF5337 domain-containing protein [Rhodobacteraceae bacterium R_SAG1]MBO9442951.1 DUF5337 domain-containing protein [Phaeobacter italicus]MBY5975139.1 DUF5337 domain-containing protein [Phaeobacter italicus]